MNCQHIKKSRLKLDQITKNLLPDLVILQRINFKSIPSLEEHWCRHSCCSCPIADTNQSSGDNGCTLRTIVLFQLSPTKKHLMPSNLFELVVTSFFQSSAMLGVNKPFEQPLKLQFYQLLMIFSSWWSSASNVVSFWWCCFWWGASDDVSTSGALCLQNIFSSDASSFLLVDSIVLICSSRTYALKKRH